MAKNLKLAPIIELYSSVLTEKQREVIELYYFEDLSLAEIAEHSGISRQGVRDSIKRGEAIISELEESLGFFKAKQRMNDALDEIRSEANDIEVTCQQLSLSNKVEKAANRIIEIVDSLD